MGEPAIAATDSAASQTVFGISRLAREFRLDRRTVVKRLESVPPNGKDTHGHDGWTLDVAAPALLELNANREPEEPKVRAYDQDKFYAAQLKRIEYMKAVGELMLRGEARAIWLEKIKTIAQWLDSLADNLERAAGLTPKQVEALERRIDEMRGDLHAELTKNGADDKPA
jgi:hypothetical protein